MWERVNQISDEDNGRHEVVQEALDTQASLYKQLSIQDKALPLLWNAIHVINPENPTVAALAIAANAERLKDVIKSYTTGSQ